MPERDKEPVLFRKVFGALRPVTPAAKEWMESLPDHAVRIEAHNIRGNTKRLALYWICLKKACELLSDAVDGVLSRRALHRWLKREEGLATPIVSKKTGEIIDYDYESIAFENMPEHERAKFIDAALERISKRLGCDVTALRDEAQAEFGEAA
ncbi:MAG TPA: hypothetical protein VFS91_01475 [Nitrobacter sp.]|nr:hypothetical protein [Nitrobacter sp.]